MAKRRKTEFPPDWCEGHLLIGCGAYNGGRCMKKRRGACVLLAADSGPIRRKLELRQNEVIDALASKWLDAQKGWVAIDPEYKKFRREVGELRKQVRSFLKAAKKAKGPNIVNRVRGKKIGPCSDGRGYQEDCGRWR